MEDVGSSWEGDYRGSEIQLKKIEEQSQGKKGNDGETTSSTFSFSAYNSSFKKN